jgi:uncharacterized membrane protein (UPF0182 family)
MSAVATTQDKLAALRRFDEALQAIFDGGTAKITAAAETRIQNALISLKSSGCDRETIRRAEQVMVLLSATSQAQRNGRPNLYASKMLRLRRAAAA